jgi:hypothetical protein
VVCWSAHLIQPSNFCRDGPFRVVWRSEVVAIPSPKTVPPRLIMALMIVSTTVYIIFTGSSCISHLQVTEKSKIFTFLFFQPSIKIKMCPTGFIYSGYVSNLPYQPPPIHYCGNTVISNYSSTWVGYQQHCFQPVATCQFGILPPSNCWYPNQGYQSYFITGVPSVHNMVQCWSSNSHALLNVTIGIRYYGY